VRLRNVFSQGARGFFVGVYGDVDFEIDGVEVVEMTPGPTGTILGFLGHNDGRFCVRNCTYKSAAGATGVKWEGGISHYPFGAAAIVEYVNNDVEVPLRPRTWGLCVLKNSGSGILVKSNRAKAFASSAVNRIGNHRRASRRPPLGLQGKARSLP
jgi:hypothetical protein